MKITNVGRIAKLGGVLILAGVGAWGQRRTAAPGLEQLFDDTILHEIRLQMEPNDWATLVSRYQENTYYKVDMEWGGVQAQAAGIRSRGNGSRNPFKPGFKISFSKFDKAQRFLGLETLILDNMWQDDAHMAEQLTMELFRRMGIPAPRESYAKLFLNGIYIGLYAIVEEIDGSFLTRTMGDRGGYLYEYGWIMNWNFEDLGDDPATYVPSMFKPVTQTAAADAIVRLVEFVNGSGDADFESNIAEHLDVERFLTYVAIEAWVSEGDGLTGQWGMNNFYFYRPAESERFLFLPWDKDGTFADVDKSVLANLERNVLVKRLLGIANHAEFYLNKLEELSKEHGGQENWMARVAERKYNLIREAVAQDANKRVTENEFEAQAGHVRYFIEHRSDIVSEQVGMLRTAPVLMNGR